MNAVLRNLHYYYYCYYYYYYYYFNILFHSKYWMVSLQ